jgi:hypothetical protein
MKIFIVVFSLFLLSFPSQKEPATKVYVCISASSERYHAFKDCRGLQRCNHEIKEVSIEEAKKMGKTPCHICYR